MLADVIEEAKRIIELNEKAESIKNNLTRYKLRKTDPESSIKSSFVRFAQNKFTEAIVPKYKNLFPDNDLEQSVKNKIIDIKKFILNKIIEDTCEQNIIEFINANKEKLISNDQEILIKSLEILNSNTDVNQIAWRNFNPFAETFMWANLFSEESFTHGNEMFSMQEAGNNMDLEQGRKDIRLRLAYYFCAVTDTALDAEEKELLQANFIGKLADIRRAHNGEDREFGNENDIDDPSCYPGVISRLAEILDSKEMVMQEEQKLDRVYIVTNVINAFICSKYKDTIDKYNSTSKKQELYMSLTFFSEINAEDFLRCSLVSSLYEEESFNLRKNFKTSMGSNQEIYQKINKMLKSLGHKKLSRDENIIIKSALANLGGKENAAKMKVIYECSVRKLEQKRADEQNIALLSQLPFYNSKVQEYTRERRTKDSRSSRRSSTSSSIRNDSF